MARPPDWGAEAPPEVFAAVIRAAEHAAYGRADAASLVVADSRADPSWLRLVAVRTLAGLVTGPHAGVWFDKIRGEAHELAAETGAPDEQVRLCLAAVALAEAYERGAIGRCDELVAASEFTDLDVAVAAAVLAGQVVQYAAGPQAFEVFASLRERHGLDAP